MCGLECVAGIYRYGKKHVGHRKCQSVEYYLPWAYGKEDEPIETLFSAPVMANDYGFDSWEMNSICDWLYDCHKTYIKESLGLCDWAYPISYSFGTPDRFGDPELEAKLFSAITGVSSEVLEEIGERIYNLQRLILLREGRRTPDDDYPMPHNFTEPLESPAHTGIMVPGPGDSVVDTRGRILDREKYMAMLKEYYRLRGWDEETGLPFRGTLEKLGISGFTSDCVE